MEPSKLVITVSTSPIYLQLMFGSGPDLGNVLNTAVRRTLMSGLSLTVWLERGKSWYAIQGGYPYVSLRSQLRRFVTCLAPSVDEGLIPRLGETIREDPA